MKKRRIVVTGVGSVSCFGTDTDVFFQNLLKGQSGVTQIEKFDVSEFPTQIAAYIKDFDPAGYIDPKLARRADPFILFAMVAGKNALKQAGYDFNQPIDTDLSKAGVIVGSGMGGMEMFLNGTRSMMKSGIRRISPFFIPFIIPNMAGSLLAKDLGFQGPNYSVSTACATATHAIYLAGNHIFNGDADVMICGGSEACVNEMGLGGFCAIKALSKRNDNPQGASRPWDKERDGFVMGEGAGLIVLEELEHALKRNAPILAEYVGGGASCDAHHMTEPHPDGEGIYNCIHMALEQADVDASRVNYINAHATSTPVGDMSEINALTKVFKDPSSIYINATKSMIGHSLGAAGGLEAIATIMSIHHKKIHPTINLENPEDVPFIVPTEAQDLDIDVALSNSYGFGGNNASLLFKAY